MCICKVVCTHFNWDDMLWTIKGITRLSKWQPRLGLTEDLRITDSIQNLVVLVLFKMESCMQLHVCAYVRLFVHILKGWHALDN